MTTLDESIAQAIVTLLTVPPLSSVPADDVYRDLIYALDLGIEKALAIEEGDNPPPVQDTVATKERSIDIHISAIRKGVAPYSLCDALILESHNRIIADRSLGGLAMDIQEGPTKRQRDALDKSLGVVTKTYRVVYRTGADSLE